MPDTTTETIENRTWTTWEELLLACAVKRHGLNDWDSVSTELQMRSSLGPSTLTARICETKYYDLRCRFNPTDDRLAGDEEVDSVPWLEELRKVRVAELKQEVHRYDLSIQSLQLKVKRLQDEGERSLRENDRGCEKPDLDKDLDEARSETDKKDGEGGPQKISSDGLADKFVADEDCERRDRSSNESTSTENRENYEKRVTEPVRTGEVKPDPDPNSVKEDSCNDSSDTIAKQSQEKRIDVDWGELRDSAAESKEGMKESSDVQSSASLTKQRRSKGEVSCGGDEPLVVSPATTPIKRDEPGRPESLVEFFQVIKSHKHGSVFERRLESQRTDRYKNVVRKHVDLETVHTRLDDGSYSSCAPKFYLDLLLVFTNVIAFFPKSSQESVAAHQLRDIVLKELRKKRTEQQSTPSSDSTAIPVQPKFDPESLLDKHKSSAPILVCRKRSSISSKATSANKLEKAANEKVGSTLKPLVKSSSSTPVEEDSSLKLKVKEKPVTGVRSMRRSSSSPNVSVTNKNQITNSGATVKMEPGKTKKKDTTPVTVITAMTKKRGAADFLKRMKKNSPAKGTVVAEASKALINDVITPKREQKKKVEERREATRRKNAGERQVKESSPSKRNIGRPRKKEKDIVVAPTSAKRGREIAQEAEGSSKRPTKRSRK